METIERLFKDLETENPKRFSPEQLRTFTSDFSNSLGSGGFGDVYKGVLHNGVQVAVKVLKEEILSEGIKDQFKAEMSVLCKTHHRNLARLCGFCFEQNLKALVYEFMENESLDKILYGNQSIEWETLCKIAIGTASGLSYLHEDCQPRIIHYDIKPSNILLDSKFSPKVGDFGLARLLNQDKSYVTESRFRGTPNYVAPELCMPYSSVTHKCDVYSFGITLFDIIGRRRHLLGEGQKWFPIHVWYKFEDEQHEELLEECGIREKDRDQAKRILLIALQCVQFLPDNRPSMSHVLRLLEGREVIDMPPNPFLYLEGREVIGRSSTRIESSSSKENDTNSVAPTKAILTGPWGGLEGNNWDDGVYSGVKQILLFREGKEIHGIQVKYIGKNGESIWSKSHGSTDSYTRDIIKFDYPSEILTRITGYYASGHYLMPSRKLGFHLVTQLRSLCFFTNKKKHGPFGDEVGTYFSSWMDAKVRAPRASFSKVVGFHGRSKEFLDAIGLHMDYSLCESL